MIYIIRHGQTELNYREVLQGRSNYPLNEVGIAQAKEAAKKLRDVSFDRVYSSPLTRAVETAQLLAPSALIVTDGRLIEMDYGPYEGMDLNSLTPEVLSFFSDFINQPAPEGMEPLQRVVDRAGSFLEDCCRSGENILISTHAIAMKGLLEYLTPESNGSYWSKYIGNCDIYVADFSAGSFSIPREL